MNPVRSVWLPRPVSSVWLARLMAVPAVALAAVVASRMRSAPAVAAIDDLRAGGVGVCRGEDDGVGSGVDACYFAGLGHDMGVAVGAVGGVQAVVLLRATGLLGTGAGAVIGLLLGAEADLEARVVGRRVRLAVAVAPVQLVLVLAL